jgi:Protein of unknown function (DUF3455)
VKIRLPRLFIQVPLIGLLAGCAASPATPTEELPLPLRISTGAVLSQRLHATGVQIYQCRADKDDATRFAWQFKEPEADLFDAAGKKIGKHYAGPSWEAQDGSKVTGEVVGRSDSAQPDAIPWLLLRTKLTSGSGIFSAVRFIQRLHTVGGGAPANGCAFGSAGREVRVPYSADYWFYVDQR